jgi:hypothetical protein
MTKIIDFKSKRKAKEVENNTPKSIHKLNLKLNYIATLTDLINEADSDEYDAKLYEGITHKVNSMKGNQYIITLTKVKQVEGDSDE